MRCKDERAAVLECYRGKRDASSGEIVFACRQLVADLDRCAALAREAAIAKVVPNSLPDEGPPRGGE